MRAIVYQRYGGPEQLRLTELPVPEVTGDRVLIRVRAAAANPLDWRLLRADPMLVRLSEGVLRPKRHVPGADVAGIVEAVGPEVGRFAPGDEVLGGCAGSFAERVRAREGNLAHKPPGLSFEHAAAIPTAGCTALQAVRDQAGVRAGDTVLVNGAAGGVGTFVVQIAKASGAEVTGVCSTANVELVRSLGADVVVDYTSEDFARAGRRHDVVIDTIGNRSLRALRRALVPGGRIVLVGGGGGRLLGPVSQLIRAAVLSRLVRERIGSFLATTPASDLAALCEMVDAGTVTPVLDRTYPLAEAAEAIRYMETHRARGKVIVVPDAG